MRLFLHHFDLLLHPTEMQVLQLRPPSVQMPFLVNSFSG